MTARLSAVTRVISMWTRVSADAADGRGIVELYAPAEPLMSVVLAGDIPDLRRALTEALRHLDAAEDAARRRALLNG